MKRTLNIVDDNIQGQPLQNDWDLFFSFLFHISKAKNLDPVITTVITAHIFIFLARNVNFGKVLCSTQWWVLWLYAFKVFSYPGITRHNWAVNSENLFFISKREINDEKNLSVFPFCYWFPLILKTFYSCNMNLK